MKLRRLVNWYADLTVFCDEELKTAVPDQKQSFGIRKGWINGKTVLNEDGIAHESVKTSGKSIAV